MVFSELVRALNRVRNDSDDLLSKTYIHTLKREVSKDLNLAFEMSESLIKEHPSVFIASHSFLDFILSLIDVSPRPPPGDDRFARPHPEPPKKGYEDWREKYHTLLEDRGAWERINGELNAQLRECRHQLKACQDDLEDHGTLEREHGEMNECQLRESRHPLKACQDDLEAGVSKGPHDGWNESYSELNENDDALKRSRDTLDKKYHALKKHFDTLKKTHDALKESCEKLNEKHNALEESRSAWERTHQDKYDSVWKQYTALRTENTRVKNSLSTCEQELTRLKATRSPERHPNGVQAMECEATQVQEHGRESERPNETEQSLREALETAHKELNELRQYRDACKPPMQFPHPDDREPPAAIYIPDSCRTDCPNLAKFNKYVELSKTLQENNIHLQNTIRDLDTDFKERSKEFQNTLETEQKRLSELKWTHHQCSTDLQKAKENNEVLKTSLQQRMSEKDALENQVKQLEVIITNLKARSEESRHVWKSEKKELSESLDSTREQLVQLQSTHQQRTVELQKATESNEELQTSLQQHMSEKAALEKQVQQWKGIVNAINSEKGVQGTTLKSYEIQILESQKALEAVKYQNSELGKRLSELQWTHQQCSVELQKAKESNEELETSLQHHVSEKAALEKQVQQWKDRVNEINSEKGVLDTKIKGYETQIQKSQNALEAEKKQNSELVTELEKSKASIQDVSEKNAQQEIWKRNLPTLEEPLVAHRDDPSSNVSLPRKRKKGHELDHLDAENEALELKVDSVEDENEALEWEDGSVEDENEALEWEDENLVGMKNARQHSMKKSKVKKLIADSIRLKKWEKYYTLWLKELNLRRNVKKIHFSKRLKELKKKIFIYHEYLNEWNRLYGEWVKLLGITPKPDKSELSYHIKGMLNPSGTPVLKKRHTFNYPKGDFLIKYLFKQLYIQFFKERYTYLYSKNSEIFTGLEEKIKSKLNILSDFKMDKKVRNSKVLVEYIEMDLGSMLGSALMDEELVTYEKDIYLQKCVEDTKTFLDELVHSKDTLSV